MARRKFTGTCTCKSCLALLAELKAENPELYEE